MAAGPRATVTCATAETGTFVPPGRMMRSDSTPEASERKRSPARNRMSIRSSPSRNCPTTSPRILARMASPTVSAETPRAAARSRSSSIRISGLPGSEVVAMSRTSARFSSATRTISEAESSSMRSSEKTWTAIGGRTESTAGRTSSASARGKRAIVDRTRSTAAASSSASAPAVIRMLICARFSPRVRRPEAADGRLPTIEKTEAKEGSAISIASMRSTISAVAARVVPSGSRSWNANSPCARSGTRSVPRRGM